MPQKVAKPKYPLLWVTLNVHLRHIYIYIYVSLKPEATKIHKFWVSFWGCSTWISTRSCGMKEQSVQYTSHFSIHSMQAIAICSRNGSSCLNCGISRVLESWLFWCELLMQLCMVAFNKDDIYRLFTSTEKMRGLFQFHNFSLTW